MNRLQKKCIVAVTGFHFLLLLALVIGPGFLARPDAADTSPVLTFVSMSTTDGSSRGGNLVPAPPPRAVVTPPAVPPTPVAPQQAPPSPPQPRPVVTPPSLPPPTPEPEKNESDFVQPPKPKHVVAVSLTPVTRAAVKNVSHSSTTSSAAADDDARRAAAARRRAVSRVLSDLQDNLSSSTTVEMPGSGGGGPSFANYADLVRKIYTDAFHIPSNATDSGAEIKVSVTIARDGTVLSSQMLDASGDAIMDRAAQAALDRVKFVAPFPDGSSDSQRTFIIYYSLKAKQSLG
jgi:TonB family protein